MTIIGVILSFRSLAQEALRDVSGSGPPLHLPLLMTQQKRVFGQLAALLKDAVHLRSAVCFAFDA